MTLDEEVVNLGDKMYDISYNRGSGMVTSIGENYFEVDFGKTRVEYNENGFQRRGFRRTVFWHEPFYVIPTKNLNGWKRKKEILQEFLETVDKYESCV